MSIDITQGGTPTPFPVEYYDEDFESGAWVRGSANPTWQINTPVVESYGTGDFFTIDTAQKHSGTYSLKFDYGGKNGYANSELSGNQDDETHIDTGHDNAAYFVSKAGNDLSAHVGKWIWNKSNGWSKWLIDSVQNQNATNDRANLTKLSDPMDGVDTAEFDANDSIKISDQPGVGVRRNDVDIVVYWFNTQSTLPDYGETIYRRVYLRPSISTHADNHHKLMYFRGDGATAECHIGSEYDAVNGHRLYIERSGMGANQYHATNFVDNDWNYLEVAFTQESSSGAGDASIDIWFGASGDEETATKLTLAMNSAFGKMDEASFFGNIQHENDVAGTWHIDDFRIADYRLKAL